MICPRDGSTPPPDSVAVAMRDTMKARGPDDAGLWRYQNMLLAHRRLAIRDLESGAQPWVTPDGRYALVYNGEIYNDSELRNELTLLGYRFETRCDTEVLMQAWVAWGTEAIPRLRGMFSFAVVDTVKDRWWLVRDRCGIKPAFYSLIGNQFVFASSIKAITRHPDFSAHPNLATVRHYLSTLRLTFDNQTVFENIHSVRPAEYLEGQGTQFRCQTYWHPPTFNESNRQYDDAVNQLHSELQNAISLRLKSDVSVGMMMSGGVDSNVIAEMVNSEQGPMLGCCGGGLDTAQNPKDGESKSDFHHARSTAARLNFDYQEVQLNWQEYLATSDQLIEEYSTPLATPTDVIIFRVAERLRESVGVALGGEGADEAFCGYSVPHWSGHDFDRARNLCPSQTPFSIQIRDSLLKQYGRTHFLSPADHYFQTVGLIPLSTQQALFRRETWKEADREAVVESFYNSLFEASDTESTAQKYARVLFRLNLDSLLSRLDAATMAASLEARVPFTDHKVVELAFSLPPHFRIDIAPSESQPWLSSLELFQRGSIRSKRILRSVASRMMPEHAALRPKQSFPTPIESWLNTSWKSHVEHVTQRSPFLQSIFLPESMKLLPQLPDSLAMWNWPILNLAKWGERWF